MSLFSRKKNGSIYYVNISSDNYFLGGSALGQIIGSIGKKCPSVKNSKFFVKTFNTIQDLIRKKQIIAGHDIGSGGLITTIMEMCFASVNVGAEIDISEIGNDDIIKKLFSENAGLVFQSVDESIEKNLIENSIEFYKIGEVVEGDNLVVTNENKKYTFNISEYRDVWFKTSTILDRKQTANQLADVRFNNYKKQPLNFTFPKKFSGKI